MSRKCVVALFVALLVSACGNGEDKPTAAQEKYATQVDAICTELQSKVGDLGQDPGKQAADVEDGVNRIKAIPKPRDNSERADVYIAAMENLYLSLQDVDQSRRVNDQARAQRALDTARTNDKRAADAAKLYGMKVCAQEL
ncbi:MAG: hypothetical protein M3326_06510 [Actinomycetota bacterium]|nr:hypothetical protein [Actinomycetota bacterium]